MTELPLPFATNRSLPTAASAVGPSRPKRAAATVATWAPFDGSTSVTELPALLATKSSPPAMVAASGESKP